MEAKLTAREQIMTTAGRLFFERGYHVVGVDSIIAEAGVAKATLYRHFPSKDDLIAAYLEDANTQFWAWFDAAVAPFDDPRDKLLAAFQALEKLLTSPQCYGCAFIMAASEFPDPAHPAHRVALAHKQQVRARLGHLVRAAQFREPEMLIDHLSLLIDGAFVAVRMFGLQNPASQVAALAARLLECYS